mgnify:CR=1 FL=1|jgi:glycosyltransferase involved in cell wall biosynthesis
MKNTFVISCPIDTYSGYGARSRDFVKALIELDKYEVSILPQRWGNTPFNFIKDHEDKWGFLNDHIHRGPLTEQPDIWCQSTVPNEFNPIGKFNIGLTAGIETTACAPQWIEGMNRMDIIITSSEHSKNVLKTTKYQANLANGDTKPLELEKPIEVLFEGADLDMYKVISKNKFKNAKLSKSIDSIDESFAFLSVGHWMQGDLGHDRKNMGLLVKAFYEVWKNKNNPPALILKTTCAAASYTDRREILNRINIIRDSIPNATKLPKIYLIHGDLSNTDMNELYNHPKVKSFISLTRGEGFGRPLLEFSLTNKPIIASAWSGQLDFLDKEFTALVGGKLEKLHPSSQIKDMLINESEWFAPDHAHIKQAMTDVVKNYKQWLVKGKRQGFKSRENFNFESMKGKLNSILDSNVPKLAKKMELNLDGIKSIKLPKKTTKKSKVNV